MNTFHPDQFTEILKHQVPAVKDFLASHGLDCGVTNFLYSKEFANHRELLVARLTLTNVSNAAACYLSDSGNETAKAQLSAELKIAVAILK